MSDLTRWATPEFEAELRAWVEGAVGPVRLERHKLRPWSTVWKAYAGSGLYWAKQNVAPNRFEAGLVAALGEWLPDAFVPLAALEAQSGLMLMPDQGEPLGFGHHDVDSWCRIVQQWALVQRSLVDRVPEISALGVPVLAPPDVEGLVTARVGLLGALPEDDPRRLAPSSCDRVLAALPDLRRSVDEVVGLGLPLTLDHNDLHGGNVFPGEVCSRFFDLGDAMVTEPMAVLLVPLGAVEDALGCDPDDLRLWRVADAWAEVWSDVASPTDLRRVLPHAMRLSRLARHHSWWRVTPALDPEELTGFEAEGAEWLGVLPDRPLLAPSEGWGERSGGRG